MFSITHEGGVKLSLKPLNEGEANLVDILCNLGNLAIIYQTINGASFPG